MDASQRQSAIVQEVTWGTTPATPAFKVLREIRAEGVAMSNDVRSPERNSHRQAAAMVHGLTSYNVTVEMPWHRDNAVDFLWESLLNAAWTANVLKVGSTQKPFSMEIKHEGGGTDPYRRFTGCLIDTCNIGFRNGEAGTLSFGGYAKGHTTATAAIAGATYAAASPGYDPVAPSSITVNNLFSISSPKVVALSMQIRNNIAQEYAFGSDAPQFMPLGQFDVEGEVQLYFSQLTDYSTFLTRQSALTMSLTIGSVTNFKDTIELNEVDVFNPSMQDNTNSGSDLVTLKFMGKYDSSDASAIKMTRLVA